jgi:two-component system, NarL family, response regulator NreC
VIRVLLAEDHETVRHGLKLLIDDQPDMEVIGEVGTGRLAVQQAQALQPTVVVLDLSMPELTGVEAAREISAAAPNVAVVALTRHNDDAYVQALLSAGAAGYVLKQSASSELLKAVRAAAEGGRYLDAALTDRVAGAFIARHAPAATQPRISDREAEVLRLIAIGHSNKEIAGQLGLSVKTIEVHKANAMRKLKLRGRVDIVRYALVQGWLREA